MEPGGQTATASVTTGDPSSVSSTGATLSGSYTGATGRIYETGFLFGTDPNNLVEREDLKGDGSTNSSGSFNAYVGSLSAETTYYYQAYVLEFDATTNNYEIRKGIRMSFTTPSEGQITEPKPGYLSCGEIPAVSLSGSTASGQETFGDSNWYRYGVAGNSGQMIVTHTFKYGGKTLRNYSMLYDKSKKAALWVAFAMHATAFPWEVERSDKWVYDPALVFGNDYSWQPYLDNTYSHTGNVVYDRGHQVASNDRRTTTEQTKQTTYFSNMTPQIKTFNGGVWSTFEGNVQSLGKTVSGRDTLYVVTGPIFGSGYKTDATDNNDAVCPVPTQFFKCLMLVSYNSEGVAVSAQGAAYLFNHQAGASRQDKTIDYIESLTGFDFFTNIPVNIQNSAESSSTVFF